MFPPCTDLLNDRSSKNLAITSPGSGSGLNGSYLHVKLSKIQS